MLIYKLEFFGNAFLLYAVSSGFNKKLNLSDEFMMTIHRYLTEVQSHFIR
jgi:hypothetical protein